MSNENGNVVAAAAVAAAAECNVHKHIRHKTPNQSLGVNGMSINKHCLLNGNFHKLSRRDFIDNLQFQIEPKTCLTIQYRFMF